MTFLKSVEDAFSEYEKCRPLLPQVEKKVKTEFFRNLDYISDKFDVFLMDAFGVLNVGNIPITSTIDCVLNLQKKNKKVIVVTNNACTPHDFLLKRFNDWGYMFDKSDIVSSRQALFIGLAKYKKMFFGVMDDLDYDNTELEDLDFEFLKDDKKIFDSAEAFIFLGSQSWNENRHSFLKESLKKNKRPIFVGNPDIIAPFENKITTEPGFFAYKLAREISLQPLFFGKPFSNIFDLALAKVDNSIPMDRIIMIGDTLHTDILGARSFGIKSALVTDFGFFSNGGFDKAIIRSKIFPDYILNRV